MLLAAVQAVTRTSRMPGFVLLRDSCALQDHSHLCSDVIVYQASCLLSVEGLGELWWFSLAQSRLRGSTAWVPRGGSPRQMTGQEAVGKN